MQYVRGLAVDVAAKPREPVDAVLLADLHESDEEQQPALDMSVQPYRSRSAHFDEGIHRQPFEANAEVEDGQALLRRPARHGASALQARLAALTSAMPAGEAHG